MIPINENATRYILDTTEEQGGGTFRYVLGQYGEVEDHDFLPEEAWVVAVQPPPHYGKNRVFDGKDNEYDMGRWLAVHFDPVSTAGYFGTWMHEGKLYVVHVRVTSKETALQLAMEQGELAIFNLATGEEEQV